jgi:heme/copper-type cytochrome/quinol oxidase subunit 2
MTRRGRDALVGTVAAVVPLAAGSVVRACPVCTGNPESPLTQGAHQGILAMLIITYSVLIGLFGMLAFVIVSARRCQVNASQSSPQDADESQGSAPPSEKV